MADPLDGSGAVEPATEATQTDAPVTEDVGTTAAASPVTDDGPENESFFDPTQVPEELKPAYKQMQAAFTKKTQAIREQRQKIEAYDRFSTDPVGSMQTLAKQYGFSLTRAEAAEAVKAEAEGDEWQPQNWKEVLQRGAEVTRKQIYTELAPVLREMQQARKSQIEQTLDESIPEWRQYEDEMSELLEKHPSLVEDPLALARLALPPEVEESRAMQKALKKLEQRGKSSKVSGGSRTQRAPSVGVNPNQPMSFNDAVKAARAQLEQQGSLYVSNE